MVISDSPLEKIIFNGISNDDDVYDFLLHLTVPNEMAVGGVLLSVTTSTENI